MGKKFGFLLFDGVEDLDVVGPWEMISVWSKHYGGPEKVFTLSQHQEWVTSVNDLTMKSHYRFAECPPLDYLLIPGGQGTRTEIKNSELIRFIKAQATHCEQVLSVCTGALLLQAAGLLRDKEATTHWASLDLLRQDPHIHVNSKKRFTREGNLWTSAGVSAGIDLALAFIAAIAGDETAGSVQRYTEYYPSPKIYPCSDSRFPDYVHQDE